MTARSKRREAEVEFIDAARQYLRRIAEGRYSAYDPNSPLGRALAAQHKLDQLELEAPDAVRTGDNNPCITSSQAAEYFRKHASHRVSEVFAAIYKVWIGGGLGLTVDQLEVQLGRTHQSISPRVTDLLYKGLVKDSGRTLLTRSKQDAIVWTPTDVAIEAAKNGGGMPWGWT
jgi:hypothetical protein